PDRSAFGRYDDDVCRGHVQPRFFESARQGSPRPPQARPGTRPGGATARAQPPLKYGDERLGNLGARQRLILTIPVRDPVERTGEGESGHFRIAGFDGAVLDALGIRRRIPWSISDLSCLIWRLMAGDRS